MMFPVVLGSGRKLFAETPRKAVLMFGRTQAFGSGRRRRRIRRELMPRVPQPSPAAKRWAFETFAAVRSSSQEEKWCCHPRQC
jgi:hypothetical protein